MLNQQLYWRYLSLIKKRTIVYWQIIQLNHVIKPLISSIPTTNNSSTCMKGLVLNDKLAAWKILWFRHENIGRELLIA